MKRCLAEQLNGYAPPQAAPHSYAEYAELYSEIAGWLEEAEPVS